MTDTLEVGVGVPAERVTKILPSEALRLGRLTRPRRIEGRYWEGADGACALGAIAEGSGDERVPREMDEPARCPVAGCGLHRGNFDRFAITHFLNDDHHWSDDQIVAWLEGLGL